MIRVRRLWKTYAGHHGTAAVKGIDLEVNEQEFCVLLGPSGCGKTTTLRCVAGLETPDEGEIELSGHLVYSTEERLNVPTERRDIGMVFQSYALWPHMTVFQVVAYPLTDGRKRGPGSEVAPRVRAALEMVQLDGLERRPVTDLSGGQQQRVALARALVGEPKVLLMDEPLSNLDARLRDEMRGEIKRLTQRAGVTTLYVTHDQSEALSLADKVYVMRLGEVIDSGTPERVYEAPRTRHAAQFVGQMLFIPGEVAGPACVRSRLGTLSCRVPDGLEPGAQVLLGMRPEHVRLPGDSSDGAAVIKTRVVQRLFQGDSVLFQLETNGLQFAARLPATTVAAPGECLDLAFAPDRWQVFPPEREETGTGASPQV